MAILIAVVFLRSGGDKAADFRVELTSNATRVPLLGRVTLVARVTPVGAQELEPAAFEWTASAGFFLRKPGSAAEWVAPKTIGQATITVTVRSRDGVMRTASVGMEIFDTVTQRASAGLAAHPPAAGYVVDSIEVDKTKICDNETIKVTVKGRDPAGQSQWLKPMVDFGHHSYFGETVVVGIPPSSWHLLGMNIEEKGSATFMLRATLLDMRNGGVGGEREVPIEIKACGAKAKELLVTCKSGIIDPELAKPDRGEIPVDFATCTAEPWPNDSFTPVRFEWYAENGGDHRRVAETTRAVATLELPPHVQRSATTAAVFTVKAYAADGAMREGRGSALWDNTEWSLAQQNGSLPLTALFRGTGVRASGAITMRVMLINPHDEDIQLDKISVRRLPCSVPQSSPSGRSSAEPIEITKLTSYDATSLPSATFGVSDLEPGEVVRGYWRLDGAAFACGGEAYLTGTGATSGMPAEARWIMSAPKPSADLLTETAKVAWLDQVRKALATAGEVDEQRQATISVAAMKRLVAAGKVPPPPGGWTWLGPQ